MKVSRRKFLEASATAVAAAHTKAEFQEVETVEDGPRSKGFSPLPLRGSSDFEALESLEVSDAMKKAIGEAPRGQITCWGLPFQVQRPLVLKNETLTETVAAINAEWLIFLHTADIEAVEPNEQGLPRERRGQGRLAEHVADYTIVFRDGTEVREKISRRHQIGMFQRHWGENCFQAVAHTKPRPVQPVHERVRLGLKSGEWGRGETRVDTADQGTWVNWLWAWKNPHPEKEIVSLRFEPKTGLVILFGVSAGYATSQPLRWQSRRKAILRLPKGVEFDFTLGDDGLLSQIQLDMGQVISAEPVRKYPDEEWSNTYNNKVPEISKSEIQIEYTAHQDARFHLASGEAIPVSSLRPGSAAGSSSDAGSSSADGRSRVHPPARS